MKDHKKAEDETLIRLIAGGDDAALEELYERYARLLFSVAVHIVGDGGAAEEITLDVLTNVWKKADSYRAGRGAVNTWLVSITRYRSIDWLRRHKSRPESTSISWADTTTVPHSSFGQPEQAAGLHLRRKRIREALGQLPEEQQQVLLLGYFRGLSQNQIAERLDLPLGTVKTRMRLGLKKLRFLLREEWQAQNK